MWEEKSKKILPQPGIELTTTWWSKKLMNFQLKLYHWATAASYRGWQLTIAKLKSVCVLLLFYSCKYKKARASKSWIEMYISNGVRYLSQAEKKITVVTTEQIKKNDNCFQSNKNFLTFLSENNFHFVNLLVWQQLLSSQIEMNYVIQWGKIQHWY